MTTGFGRGAIVAYEFGTAIGQQMAPAVRKLHRKRRTGRTALDCLLAAEDERPSGLRPGTGAGQSTTTVVLIVRMLLGKDQEKP